MRPFNLLASIGGMKPSQASSRRRKVFSRALRVESLESRVPPSAFAVLLDFEASEQTDVILRSDIEEALTSATLDGAVTVGTFSAVEEAPSLPVLQPTATSVKVDVPEPLQDIRAIATVMEMGSAAWQPVAPAGDSGDMVFATSFGAPAPSQPGEPIGTDPGSVTLDNPQLFFEAVSGEYGWWHLKGDVVYEHPRELKVVFTGAVTGETHVTLDGIFNYSVKPEPGTSGMVSAQAFGPGAVQSNIDWDWIV